MKDRQRNTPWRVRRRRAEVSDACLRCMQMQCVSVQCTMYTALGSISSSGCDLVSAVCAVLCAFSLIGVHACRHYFGHERKSTLLTTVLTRPCYCAMIIQDQKGEHIEALSLAYLQWQARSSRYVNLNKTSSA